MNGDSRTIDAIVDDPRWLPHRIDRALERIEFVFLDRDGHRAATFLEDKHLPADLPRQEVRMAMAAAALRDRPRAPIAFIFHSTFCLSTLAVRLFDRPGIAMGLKEPVILSWLAGHARRGVAVTAALDVVLALLARPMAPGEAIVVKPSNVANLLIGDMLALRPAARAMLLYSPLRDFLLSVAKKGMWGRIEARRLFALLASEGTADRSFSQEETFLHTDLQIAARAWLGHHGQFAGLLDGDAGPRLRTLDSARFAGGKQSAAAAMAAHLGIAVDLDEIAASGVFDQHAKELGRPYDSDRRTAEAAAVAASHGEEVDMVSVWATRVADHVGVPMMLSRALADR